MFRLWAPRADPLVGSWERIFPVGPRVRPAYVRVQDTRARIDRDQLREVFRDRRRAHGLRSPRDSSVP